MTAFQNYKYDEVTRGGSMEIHGLDISIVNGVRRVILTELPYVAFRAEPFETATVKIIANNGPLHNEFLSHRFSLLPIHLPLGDVKSYQEGDLKFTLKVSNEESHAMQTITTQNLQLEYKGIPIKSEQIFPLDPITKQGVVITRLRKKETIEAEGHAVIGTARNHAGFSPVSLCTYMFLQTPEAKSLADPLERERTYLKNEHGDASAVLFQIESECGHNFHELLMYGFEILLNKVKIYQTNLPQMVLHNDTGYDFIFDNEDDTLGNILQTTMFNKHLRDQKTESKKVSYVGYFCPHPLEKRMVLRVCTEGNSMDTSREVFEDGLAMIVANLEACIADLKKVTPDSVSLPDFKIVQEDVTPIIKVSDVAVVVPVAVPEVAQVAKAEQVAEAVKVEPVQEPAKAVTWMTGTDLKGFFESKNIPEEKVPSLKAPIDAAEQKPTILNMKLSDRLAIILKDYKSGRKPTVVVTPGGVGTLAHSLTTRFAIVKAHEPSAELSAALVENLKTLASPVVVCSKNELAAPAKGRNDLLLINSAHTVNIRSVIQKDLNIYMDIVKPSFIAIILNKKAPVQELQNAMLDIGWALEKKEIVLKEVLLSVFSPKEKTTPTNE